MNDVAAHPGPEIFKEYLTGPLGLRNLAALTLAMPSIDEVQGDGHSVIVIPGLLTSDRSTKYLRDQLNRLGFNAVGWGQGRNYGPRSGVEERLRLQIQELRAGQPGRKVSLVGISLGGLFARQLAKSAADDVRTVVTLGSPFSGDPTSTKAWQIYNKLNDSHTEEQIADLRVTPPVPTTAIFSRTDEVCAWQCCVEVEGPRSENIEVLGSHFGLAHNPAAVYAVAQRLSIVEGEWHPFADLHLSHLFKCS